MITLIYLAISTLFAANSDLVKVDQVEYIQSLRKQRPDLMTPETCKPNLILKPEYRKQVLSSKESAQTIIKEKYSEKEQAQDQEWADSHRKAMSQLAQPQKPPKGGTWLHWAKWYNPKEYIGFYLGTKKIDTKKAPSYADVKGIGYKVYFQPKSHLENLRPADALAFAKALAAAGYKGDFKIQMIPEKIRFYFNNIVMHAQTKADAFVAEKVGKDFFGDRAVTTGRGVDVDIVRGKKDELDWSEFLCKYEISDIPQYALDFVKYKDENKK